ncbi:MAG: NAD+ synthase [Sphingobacteriales bacterium]|nr:NAD+ synthase [Sphingobacteriales bacterium]
MRIALAQFDPLIGDIDGNAGIIIERCHEAKGLGADLVVFPELCLCGYPPLDLIEQEGFVDSCEQALKRIAEETAGISVILGSPVRNPGRNGKDFFNAAVVLQSGSISHTVAKTLLPTYDVFDEYRWFEPNRSFECITVAGIKIALTICEDLWNMEEDPLYTFWPMKELIRQDPELMINIAASPFAIGHEQERMRILSKNVKSFSLPLVYVNCVGAQSDILFDGASLVYDSQGELVHRLRPFAEDLVCVDFQPGTPKGIGAAKGNVHATTPDIESLHQALLMGIGGYFRKMGFRKALVGLSGGIDSAVVLTLAADALGAENVHAVLMPSAFSSPHSVQDALDLVHNLGCKHEVMSIQSAYDSLLETLKPSFIGTDFGIAEENIQARIRGLLLMGISNKHGYILLNTSNKSELAVGYGTLYGDMCGGLSVIGDCFKTEVYALADHINRAQIRIPENSIHKAPSAELRPGQFDSDSLPDYEVLDRILKSYLIEKRNIGSLVFQGFDEQLVRRIVRMVDSNEWKRHQFAPILRVSSKAFGSGRRMPLVARKKI